MACAVGAESLRDGVVASVNHSGDSDSTGALCGNLLGALHGLDAIPVGWLDALDGRGLVEEVAEDFIAWLDWNSDGSAAGELGPIWMERYASGL